MSFHYLPALAEASLAPSSSDGAQSAPSSVSPIASKPSNSDSEMDSSSTSPSGTMCRPLTGDPGVDAWISYLRDSHVSPSPSPVNSKPQTMNETCGRRRLGSFGKFDPDGYCWRTSQASLLLPTGICTPYSETWPRAGLIVNGAAYRLNQSVRPTEETDCGLWPTPAAGLHNLAETPDSFMDRQEKWKGTYYGSIPLTVAVKLVPAHAKPAGSFGASGAYATGRPADVQENMTEMSSTAQPSPDEVKAHLSPDWVEWLMGWPVGWTSLEPMTELGSWFDETWWDEEPVPRITTNKTNRTKRLRAIGNGQVPACVVAAWRLLGVMVASEGKHEGHHQGQG